MPMTAAGAIQRLLFRVCSQHAEDDWDGGINSDLLAAARGFAGDIVEVWRIPADHSADADHRRDPTGIGQGPGSHRQFERARNPVYLDMLPRHSHLRQPSNTAVQQFIGDMCVEAGSDDSDAHVGGKIHGKGLWGGGAHARILAASAGDRIAHHHFRRFMYVKRPAAIAIHTPQKT